MAAVNPESLDPPAGSPLAESTGRSIDRFIDSGARRLGKILLDAGHRALLAGGCVRDLMLGRTPKDWDLVTDATSGQMTSLFERTVDIGGRRYGILQVHLAEGTYEVAQLRREEDYSDGRRPDEVVYTHDPAEDAIRRDFTVNGMMYDLATNQIVDVVGGQADLRDGVIRAIGDPPRRFGEDHLRLLRAVRFAARLGFDIEPMTWQAIIDAAPQIQVISAERIRDELTLILTQGGAVCGFGLLLDSGLLQHILPEVAALKDVAQPPEHHPEGDVWEHVLLMLAEVDKQADPDVALAWSVLLHDIGKPPTFTVSDRIRFHGHDALGAEMADRIGRRLRMSNDLRRRIVELTRHHMRFHNAPKMRTAKLRRFLLEAYFPQLLELHRIDCVGCHGKLDIYDFCRLEQDELATLEAVTSPARLINGDDLIDLGYAPGRAFAGMLEWVEDERVEGRLHDRAAALAAIRRQFPLA